MYITVNNSSDFMNEFHNVGRGDQFSYEALELLWYRYNELADYELDAIAICCEWAEYKSIAAACEGLRVADLDELYNSYQVIALLSGGVLVSG